MKRFSFLALVSSFALAACGGAEQPVAEAPVAPPAQEQAVADTPDPATEVVDEAPEMVEESAAEEEDVQAVDQPIILAQAETPAASQEWKFKEGVHYARLVPTQPTVGGADKIEVAEVFWYGCGHCNDFEAFIDRWLETKPANVRFVRIPAIWNPLVKLHAQLYYTEEVLGNAGKIADKKAIIYGQERISRPGRRVYRGKDELPKVLNGLGVTIVSTSQGVMTDADARSRGIGGEVLCKVW